MEVPVEILSMKNVSLSLEIEDELPISLESEELIEDISISLESEFLIGDIPMIEENYTTWKDKMESFLKNIGLWDYAVGGKCEPENTSNKEYEDWKLKKGEIISIFRKKCGIKTRPYIEGLYNITLIWKQLVTMNEFIYPTKTGIGRRSTNYTWCLPFYKAIVDGNRKTVSQFLLENEGVLTVRLTSEGDLPIHVAVQKGKVEIAKEFIKKMPTKLLSEQGKHGRTVLHVAASGGNEEIVKAIVEKDAKLVMIKSKYYMDRIPIIVAARANNKDVVNYLYPITINQEAIQKEDNNGQREITRATILTRLIFGDFYEQAFDLLKKYPHLVLTKDDCKYTAVEALSIKPAAFQSSVPNKRRIGTLGYCFMNSLLDVHVDFKNARWCTRGDVENSFDANEDNIQGNIMCGLCTSTNCIIFQFCKGLWLSFRRLFQNALIKLVPHCKYIYEEKLKHYEAYKLVKEVWRLLSEVEDLEEAQNDVLVSAMFRATRHGIVEFIEECINNCPQLLSRLRITSDFSANEAGQTIFHHAISNRQEKIFGLIHRLGPLKNDIATMKDASGNRMSHLAAKKAPTQRLNQVSGAALQMQRELLWYKEVESVMPSIYELYENNKKETSIALFTEEHKELLKEGAAWMKDTSTQCMVVATLITTIIFAAVFTIPGTNKESSCDYARGVEYNYIHGKFPIIFVISNILALCSSVASMLVFLAIITSRYAEEDFLSTLPRMLMMGLLFLFVSIVGMMIAFVAVILVMLRYEVLWISLPIVFVAIIPVTIYALVELPLFMQLMFTTASSDVFFGKRNLNKHA